MSDSKSKGVKSAMVIQAINAFIDGVVYVILPLLMLERGISVKSMGLIFAILPLVRQFNRVVFAVISDYIGRKAFYWLSGITNTISLLAYYFASDPFGFLAGKIGEAIKDASLWSVNRAYFLDHSEKRERSLLQMRGVGYIFYALGIIGTGILTAALLYNKMLIILMVLSLLIIPLTNRLVDKDKRKISILAVVDALRIGNKSSKFKRFFWLYFINGLYYGLCGGYIFPLFLKESGFTIEKIGLVLGIQSLLSGIVLYFLRSRGEGKNKLLIGGFFSSLFLILISLSMGSPALPVIVALMGLFTGIAEAGGEKIFVEVADHGSFAGDIGILMIGVNVGMSATQAVSGFLISSLGFTSVFLGSAILNLLFIIPAFKTME